MELSYIIQQCLKCESGSSRFQLGEGPSRGLLRDYEHSDGSSFQALINHPWSPRVDVDVGYLIVLACAGCCGWCSVTLHDPAQMDH